WKLVHVHRVRDELYPDECQDEGNAVFEVHEAIEQPAEQEVELAEAHEREHVRGEHDERALRDAEDGGYGVEREEYVGGAERDEHNEERSPHALAIDRGAQPTAVIVVGNRHDLL